MSVPSELHPAHDGASGAASTALLAVVFTDIVGSTAARQGLGDRVYADAVGEHHAIVRRALADCRGGEEIETAGDSFLLAFATASEAVRFALLADARLRRWNEGREVPLRDRFGVHMGEIVVREGARKELFSLALDTCARVTGLGDAGRVLLTRAVFDSARQHLPATLGEVGPVAWWHHGRYVLQGIDAPVELCEVGPAGEERRPPPDGEKGRRISEEEQRTVAGWRPAPGAVVPGTPFVIERPLGGGAVGEAWLARHRTLKDLRVFKFCFDAERLRSLRREVTLFRVLQQRVGAHPNIVRLHDVQLETPPYYLVTDYSEGRDLLGWWEERQGQVPLADRLELVAQVADALQAAHDAGVLHRDVKPANVLVEDRGGGVHARLLDFGIGQVVSEEVLSGMTRMDQPGTMLAGEASSSHSGTAMYMAPELVGGKGASPRSDVFSLGVVLWQLVVGDLKRALPPDWEGSVEDPLLRDDLRQCFAGDPAARFPGAGQLARNLRDLPARRARAERVERAAFRKGVARTVGIAAIAVLVVGGLAAVAWVQAGRAEEARDVAQQQAREERARLVRAAIDSGNAENDRGDPIAALPHLVRALQLVEGDADDERDVRVALEATLRTVPRLAFLATTTADAVALSPDETRLATSDGRTGKVRLFDTGSARQTAERTVPPQPIALTWSADGGTLALSSLWSTELVDGRTLVPRTAPLEPHEIVRGFWSAQRRREADLAEGMTLDADLQPTLVWIDLATGERVAPPVRAPPGWQLLSLSADHRTAAFTDGTTVQAVDVPTGRVLLDTFDDWLLLSSANAALDPTGRWLVHGSGETGVLTVDALRGPLRAPAVLAHQALVYQVAWSADGTVLATGGRDRTARTWDVPAGRGRTPPLRHLGEVYGIALGDSGRLATVEGGEIARIWQERPPDRPLTGEAPRAVIAVAAGGDRVIALLQDGSLACVTPGGARCGRPARCPDGSFNLRSIQIDPSLRWAYATCVERPVVRSNPVVDLQTGEILHQGFGSQPGWRRIAWSRDGALAVVDYTGTVRIWRAEGGEVPMERPAGVTWVAWKPDGRALATCGDALEVWDPADGARVWSREGACGTPAWSADGTLLAAMFGQDVRVVSAATGIESGPVLHHPRPGLDVAAWSPDGRRLATVSVDGYLRLWDPATGALAAPPARTGRSMRVAFTADGRHLMVEPLFDLARLLFSTPTGQLVIRYPPDAPRPPVPPSGEPAVLWDLDPGTRPVEDWVAIAGVYALERVGTGVGDTLDRDTLVALWTDLARKYPADFGWDGGQ